MKKRNIKKNDVDNLFNEILQQEQELEMCGFDVIMKNGEIRHIGLHNYFYALSNDIWQNLNCSEKLYIIKLFLVDKFASYDINPLVKYNEHKITIQEARFLIIDYDLLNNQNLESYKLLIKVCVKLIDVLEEFKGYNKQNLFYFMRRDSDNLCELLVRAVADADILKAMKLFKPNMIAHNNKAFECLDCEFSKLSSFGESDDSTYAQYSEYKKEHMRKLNNLQSNIDYKLELQTYTESDKKNLYYCIKYYLLEKIEQYKNCSECKDVNL